MKHIMELVNSAYNTIITELSKREEENGSLAGSHINITNYLKEEFNETEETLFITTLVGRISTTLTYNQYTLIHEIIDDNYIIAIATK